MKSHRVFSSATTSAGERFSAKLVKLRMSSTRTQTRRISVGRGDQRHDQGHAQFDQRIHVKTKSRRLETSFDGMRQIPADHPLVGASHRADQKNPTVTL